jgi:hypothetical protein
MKFTSTLILFLIITCFQSCSNSRDNASNSRQSNDNIPTMVTPSSNASSGVLGLQHYVCPNGCEGSGGPNAGNCPVCGTAYIHNASYHAQTQSQPQVPASDPNAISPIFIDKSKASSATVTGNAAVGLEHYTCPNGCVGGGSNTSGNCSVCGAVLTHNTAYHNQSSSSTVSLEAPNSNVSGGFHYICPNGCEGGGSSASGNCPVCGTALVHNTAYHNQSNSNAAGLQAPTSNNAGVFHYICSNGCEGSGSNTSGNCPVCGQALAHNSAYHQ